MTYSNEAELCERFAAVAREDGWKVYAETGGWDVLLVGPDGVQAGVQAKMRANLDVVSQALDPPEAFDGPDYHCVLVPKRSRPLIAVCAPLRIVSLDGSSRQAMRLRTEWRQHFRWTHRGPVWVPPFEPDVPAGVPAPRQVTRWKIAAIRVCLVLRDRGYVTSKDFREQGIHPSLWVGRWIEDSGRREGRFKRYVAKPGARRPDEDHPDIAAKIREAS